MKIAIIGRSQILYNTVIALQKEGHQIGAIITAKALPEYNRTEKDFKHFADNLGIPFIFTNSLNIPGISELCRDLDIGISINWMSTIQEEHIGLFRLGILNAHYGDLPRYRGNASINWAIINGENTLYISIHFMEGGKLDCGRIVGQKKLVLDMDMNITDVYDWMEQMVPSLFVEVLRKLETDSNYILKYADIDRHDAFRCYPRLHEDGYINWSLPVIEIHNLIRAVCFPFAGAYTYHYYNDTIKKLIIFKSRIINYKTNDFAMPGHVLKNDKESGESYVRCGDGVLSLLKCRYEGEPEVFNPGQRWKSIRLRLGIRAEDWLWIITNQKRSN